MSMKDYYGWDYIWLSIMIGIILALILFIGQV